MAMFPQQPPDDEKSWQEFIDQMWREWRNNPTTRYTNAKPWMAIRHFLRTQPACSGSVEEVLEGVEAGGLNIKHNPMTVTNAVALVPAYLKWDKKMNLIHMVCPECRGVITILPHKCKNGYVDV
jgi:hypothetical protein